MGATIDTILEAMPWDDHGVHVAFDRQGRATVHSTTDDRYVRIEARQVSGIATSNLVNGLVVTLFSPTTGQLDRMAFQFDAHGVPAKLTRLDRGEWFWTEARGSSRYTGALNATELVRAVAGFMATVGIIRPASDVEHVEELDPLSTLVIELDDGPEWNEVLSNGIVGYLEDLHRDNGLVHHAFRITKVTTGERNNPGGFEAVFGHNEDGEGEAVESSEAEYLIGSIVKVVVL